MGSAALAWTSRLLAVAGVAAAGLASAASAQDLCAGLVTDKAARPMTALAKPALLGTVVDPQFGTTIRRITAVPASTGEDAVIKPMYSTISAWNADESYLLLYQVGGGGGHRLYDGHTYAFLRTLDIDPPDLEQVYWHTSDPDILFYVDDRTLVRYHVSSSRKEAVRTFEFCSGPASGGSDPMFTSWDSARLALRCGSEVFIYDIPTNTITGRRSLDENPAQVAPSGTLAFRSDSGVVTDAALNPLRTLDLVEPWGHASLGRLANGHDTWNGAVYDEGPHGNDDIGILVTWDLTDATSRVIVGPKTGWPYPADGHISMLAYKRPGWAVVSTQGDTSGAHLLDMELLLADTNTGRVCRAGRTRTWGKDNTQLDEPYWAEAHAVPSPSGTRVVFGSDWGNGTSVDTYVLELPAYTAPTPQPVWHPYFAVQPLETPYVGDFNGDGRTDIITFTRQNPLAIGDVYVALSNGTQFVDHNGTPGMSDKWHDWFAVSTNETVVIGDYDGDGKDDIATWLGQTTRQVYVALSTGSGMTPATVWSNSLGVDATDVPLAGDVNGDGKQDMVLFARKQGKVYVALSTGSGFGTPKLWHGFFAVSTYERPRVADVTGDGKADIVTFATDSPTAKGDVYVAVSDGTKFTDANGIANNSTKWHDWFAVEQSQTVRIGNVDRDARADFFTFLPLPFAQCYTVRSLGTSMDANVLWPETLGLWDGDEIHVGDVDGDGRSDVIVFARSRGKVFVSLNTGA